MSNDYQSPTQPNTALEAAFAHYSKFVQGTFQDTPFINYDFLEKGIVQVMLILNGNLVLVVVDDFLPCIDNEPLYASTKSGSMWCSFVEKALAKIFGGY